MKKILLIFIFIISASGIDISQEEKYVENLLNYHLQLPEIFNPMVVLKPQVKKVKKVKKIKKLIPKVQEVELMLLAILNNKVLLKIGGVAKWYSIGDKAEGYVIEKIINSNSILLKHNNKVKIVTLDNKKFNIKVRR